MRKKKNILVFGTDDDYMGIICLVLAWKFTSKRFVSKKAAVAEIRKKRYDAVLVLGEHEDAVKELHWRGNHVVVYAVGLKVPLTTYADKYVLESFGVGALIEALKVATARKRGPRKGYPAVVIEGGVKARTVQRKEKAA